MGYSCVRPYILFYMGCHCVSPKILFYIKFLATMQDCRDRKKKKELIAAKFVMGYSCVRLYILFYIHGPDNLHCF